MMKIVRHIKEVIKQNNLEDWFEDYPWLTGSIGNPESAIWFIGENPSTKQVKSIDKKSPDKSENLQWNSSPGDRLLRKAVTYAGLKSGDPELNEGWNCYITNVIKEPDFAGKRNEKKKKDPRYWKEQSQIWLPVLQHQIKMGNPQLFVAMGKATEDILEYMQENGLECPKIEKIYHYTYIMSRPESKTGRKPGHPARIAEYKDSIKKIAENF